MNSILNAALKYINQGFKVLPIHHITQSGVCSCGGSINNMRCKPAKHPYGEFVPRGLKDASADPNVIQKWFANGRLNIGIATGEPSKIFVVDQDDRDGGDRSMQDLIEKYGPLPSTLTQRTGNGKHYLFKMPDGIDIRNSQKLLGPGIDIRGNGGYIVVAPSRHANGRNYEFMDNFEPRRAHIADAPGWLIDMVKSNSKLSKNECANNSDLIHTSHFQIPEKIEDGEGREGFLLKYAGHLRHKGTDQIVIENILLEFNRARIIPPLSEDAVLDRARRFAYQGFQVNESCSVAAEPSNPPDWPLHEDVIDTLPSVPNFPIALLPKSIATYATDISERMSCPIEFSAVALITSLSAAIGGRLHIKPEEFGTWMVPAGIWGMIVSPPSSIKTPPLSEAMRPLRDLDKCEFENHRLKLQQYEIDKGIYDKAIKDAIKLGNSNPGLVEPEKPGMTRYIVNDSTYEKLVEIAQANPNGFLIFRDELMGWFHSLNKENQKESRGLYLTGWGGTESYATDRIGRGHVRADRVNISLIGTIQPNVLRHIVNDAVTGGGGDDGLIARFQLAVFPNSTPEYTKLNRHPDFDALNRYEKLIQSFVKIRPDEYGAKYNQDGLAYLSFSPEAQFEFDTWRARLEARLRDPLSEEHPAMLAHLGKYRSLVPKLSLVLHLVADNTGPVGINAIRRAIGWSLLLESHARRIYHTATNRTMQSACALANKIKLNRLSDGFTRTDVLTKEWAGLRTAEELHAALSVLRDRNWIRSTENRQTGGRPTERFYINPNIKKQR